MFTPPLSLTFLILSAAFIGLAVGALMGLLASLLLRLKIRVRDVTVDAILGSLGFSSAFAAVLLIPWRNTVTYHVGNTAVTSTMNHYQHPYLVAYTAAMLLPIVRELRRFGNVRSNPVGDRPV